VKCKGETRIKTYLPAMESTCGSLGTARKQLEHVLGPRDDAGGDDVGDSNVVEEKGEERDPLSPVGLFITQGLIESPPTNESSAS
jgi:hypothetical protein